MALAVLANSLVVQYHRLSMGGTAASAVLGMAPPNSLPKMYLIKVPEQGFSGSGWGCGTYELEHYLVHLL